MFIHLINTIFISSFIYLVILAEEIPLNSSNSESQAVSQTRLGYDLAVDEAERRLLNVTQHPTIDCGRLRITPKQKSPFDTDKHGKRLSLGDAQQDHDNLISNLRDINAMSIASIYDRENNEIMDADK